ncbi:hypothetical protein PROFUN_11485 [Planoprotostelium fungivorum]|uniref:Uncharacterized protein n=1 Tax=Planoprotostelium fungivorum TaxID=1890364 RepID=A0A2P6N9X1_9EUKA|nr:hypothetical protein PROFUN_11485 [Planoprotostelium fungivorum]
MFIKRVCINVPTSIDTITRLPPQIGAPISIVIVQGSHKGTKPSNFPPAGVVSIFVVLFVFVLVALFACVAAWNLKLVNNVAPCPGRNYPTLKLFYSDNSQQNLDEGQSVLVDGGRIGAMGLGIQENGMYCRCCGNEGGCTNPDNAGMQLVFNQGDCGSIQLNNPFYCGAHPPNAKDVVDVSMGGSWPSCVATLTRKGNAPGCSSSC